MGGSGSGGRPYVDPTEGRGPGAPPDGPKGGGSGQGSGGGPPTAGCPTGFSAEVTDIPEEMQDGAAAIATGTTLPIRLRDGDPVFLIDDEVLGWLATNIEEVTRCLEAGWKYSAEVTDVEPASAGPVITTTVSGEAPG
jgi:hypothetical protein